MSQHFQYKHPEVSYNERKQLRAAAKIAPGRGARKKARLPPKQLTLHLVLDESAEEREKVRGADEPKSDGNGRESEGDGKSKHNEKKSENKELERGEIRRSEKGDGENSGDEERRGNRKSGEDEGESGSDKEQEGNEHQEQGKQKMPTHP